MLLYRVLTAIVGVPVLLAVFWYGSWPLLGLIGIITLVGLLELQQFWHKMNLRSWLPGMILGGILLLLPAYLDSNSLTGLIFTFLIILNLIYMIARYPEHSFNDVAATFVGSVYVGWLLSHLIFMRQLPDGFHYIVLLLATTFSTDTAAYFVGMNLGRHKLAPVLSPKKTLEGSIGGAVGSVLAAVLVGVLGAGAVTPAQLTHYIIIGLLVGVIGQAGDLVESALKRMAGIKDSGKIIPGHGGVLDRFDSLLFTGPAVYYYVRMFIIS